jgi:hypothetical protein
MSDTATPAERHWESGWEEHTLAQRRRLARLPLAEKLQWLEDSQRLLGRLRRDQPESGAPPSEP